MHLRAMETATLEPCLGLSPKVEFDSKNTLSFACASAFEIGLYGRYSLIIKVTVVGFI